MTLLLLVALFQRFIAIMLSRSDCMIRIFNTCAKSPLSKLKVCMLLALTPSLVFSVTEDLDDKQYNKMSLKELTNLEVFDAASLLPTKRTKAAGTVYSFQRDDFNRLGVRRLDDLLTYVPGIQTSQYRKRHRSLWVRGQLNPFNDKLVLLVDGVRRQHVYYGNFSLGDNFPLEKIEKVEIILGPASTLYGANAFGGIISITTRNFAAQPTLEMTAEGASNARGKGTLFYNQPKLQAFGSFLNQDAPFRADRVSFIGGNTQQPLDEDYGNLFLKAAPLDGLTLSADYYKDSTPFLFIPKTQDAFVQDETLTLSANYEVGELEQGKLQANFYYTWGKTLEYEIERQTQKLGYQENQNAAMAGSTITAFKRLFEEHVLALGFNWMRTEAVNMDYERRFHYQYGFLQAPERGSLLTNPNVINDDFAVFTQDVWNLLPELELTLGGRFESFKAFGGYFNYRAALVYTPTEQQTLKLLYGTGIRTPTFREYLKVLQGTAFIAPKLEPERINTLELSYAYQWDQANVTLTLYQNHIKDYIYQVPTPDQADNYFANSASNWDMRGVETVMHLQLTQNLDIRLSGAFLDAQTNQTQKLPYLASWTGNLNVNYHFLTKHHIGLTLNYSSSRPDMNANANDNPKAFITANVFGSGELMPCLTYIVGIDNIFDARIYDPAADFGDQHSTERSEREVWGRLKWSFNP